MKALSRSLTLLALVVATIVHAGPYKLQYGGRIVQANGQPVLGPIAITANFYHQASGGSAVASQSFNPVPLNDGVFNLSIELTSTEFHTVFSGAEAWIELTDVSSGKTYPRQRFAAVPYAFKVPLDSSSLGYNGLGEIKVVGLGGNPLPSGSPTDGQILKYRSGTGWEWGSDDASPAASVTSVTIVDGSIADADVASNAAIAGSKISPNFGSQNITTAGVISGNGSGLTNLPAGPLGSSIDSSEISDGTIADADISAGAAIAQSKINGLAASLAAKEPTITAGISAQYWRGDKTWSTLDTSVIPENANLYHTDARARSAISASVPLAYNNTSGVLSLPAATSIADGYLSSADWLSFTSKQPAITAASTLNAGSLSTALQKGLEIKPFDNNAGQTGELRFNELSGSNYIGFKAPDSINADKIWTLPAADGTSGQILSTNGSGLLSWVSAGGSGTVTSITAGTGLSGGTITGSGTIDLANTAVSAGSYTRANITVDAQGRLTAAANGSALNLGTEVTGTLPLASGGTGATTPADARTNLGLGSLATLSAVATAQITDGTISNDDISASAAIDQSKINGLSTALSGKEPSITAGTNAQFYRGDKSWQTLDTGAVPENANLYFTDARARSAISGTAPVAYNSTSGAISMASATSVANGYLSSADWLTFNNKQTAISAASTVNTGTLTSALQNGVQLKPFGSNTGEGGELRFSEVTGAGSNYVGFKAPDSIAADNIWTLPAADGTSGQVLSTNGSRTLSWSSPAASGAMSLETKSADYTVTSSDGGKFFLVSGNLTTITLPTAASAGAGFHITVKAAGGWTVIAPAASEQIEGATTAVSLPSLATLQLVTDGTAWYQSYLLGTAYRGTPISCGADCYANSTAMTAGLAYTATGKALVLSRGVWVETGGNKVLRVDGSDNWHLALNANGRSYSGSYLDKTLASLGGRVCPARVYVDNTNMTASSRCLYYDQGNIAQRLDALNSDGVTDQSTSGSYRLGEWNTAAGGNGTSASWYEGNIQTCVAKGMRLPVLYETSAADPGGSYKPTDATPTWSTFSTGVPSYGGYTWTSSGCTSSTTFYWVWSGTASDASYYAYAYTVRCVVP